MTISLSDLETFTVGLFRAGDLGFRLTSLPVAMATMDSVALRYGP